MCLQSDPEPRDLRCPNCPLKQAQFDNDGSGPPDVVERSEASEHTSREDYLFQELSHA